MKRIGFLSLVPLIGCGSKNDEPIALGPLLIGQPMNETLKALGNGTRGISQTTKSPSDSFRVYYSGAGSVVASFRENVLTYLNAYERKIGATEDDFPDLGIDPHEPIAKATLDISKLSWLGSSVYSNINRPTPSGWSRVDYVSGYGFLRKNPFAAVSINRTLHSGLHFEIGEANPSGR